MGTNTVDMQNMFYCMFWCICHALTPWLVLLCGTVVVVDLKGNLGVVVVVVVVLTHMLALEGLMKPDRRSVESS